MSQLYPMHFVPATQSVYIEQFESKNISSLNIRSPTIAFRPIIPKVLTKNVLSSTHNNMYNIMHSNVNSILPISDQRNYLISYNHLTSTYRSLS